MAYKLKEYEPSLEGQTKTVNPSTSQQTVTPDSGKKLTSVVVNAVPSGTHTGQVSTHTVSNPTVTPSVTGTVTNISSTTKPSGTDGTDYWTLDPSGSVTTSGTSSAKAIAKIGTSGYISTDSSESSTDEKSISATVADGTNRYISKGSATTPETTITQNPTVTKSGGNIVASYTKEQNVTPTVSTGYVSSGTAGKVTTTGTTTVAATTLESSLIAENIKSGATIFGVEGTYSGTDTSDATATASDLLSGKTAYAKGSKITGTIGTATITNNTSGGTSSGTINRGSQIKFGAGYNASDKYYTAQANSGSVTVTAGTSAKTVSGGADGKVDIIVNPTPSQSKPATTNGTIYPDSGYLLSSVTVSIPTYDGSVS